MQKDYLVVGLSGWALITNIYIYIYMYLYVCGTLKTSFRTEYFIQYNIHCGSETWFGKDFTDPLLEITNKNVHRTDRNDRG